MDNSIDQQFIEYVVKTLVEKPDEVKVDRRIDEKGVLLELTVDPEDLGRVIGKRGATAQSLRTLLRALGTKNEARYNLKIVDNGEAPSSPGSSSDTTVAAEAGDFKAEEDVKVQADDSSSSSGVGDVDDSDDASDDKKDSSSSASRTRKELEELDDLDI